MSRPWEARQGPASFQLFMQPYIISTRLWLVRGHMRGRLMNPKVLHNLWYYGVLSLASWHLSVWCHLQRGTAPFATLACVEAHCANSLRWKCAVMQSQHSGDLWSPKDAVKHTSWLRASVSSTFYSVLYSVAVPYQLSVYLFSGVGSNKVQILAYSFYSQICTQILGKN